jgi:thiamine phosphate synthase YjbQ (UPF0047 family)
MKAHVFNLKVTTSKAPEFVDITEQVCELVRQSKVQDGFPEWIVGVSGGEDP